MKTIVAVLCLLAACVVSAQPVPPSGNCEMTLTTEVAYKGQPVGKSSIVYTGLEQANVDYINKQGMNVVKAGAKVQDKGGGYALTLGEHHVCDGKTTTAPSMTFE